MKNLSLHAEQTIGRFRVISVQDLSEYKSKGILIRENMSGAQIFHIVNDDPENLFSFNFFTIPDSSNGVAHILEHSVLCGSQRYPVKDPFFMLAKGSMSTFLNAITFPDRTIYPAASTVKKDLFNLMSVYADAVFFPLLRKEHFMQEGHRLELDENGNPRFSGVVFNEMKAHYSTQDSLEAECYRSLFPSGPYRHHTGGNPSEIPSLSYEEFCAFHKKFYHPANCLIFLYGNIDTKEYLDFLENHVFSRFSDTELQAGIKQREGHFIPLEPRWKSPKNFEQSYPVSEENKNTSSVNINWLLPKPQNGTEFIANEILVDILLGSPASPIQKLILESDLGEDMSASSGLERDQLQPILTIGMRGASRESAKKIEDLIIRGIEDIIHDGFDENLLQASLRRSEFELKEIKGGGPFGLRLLLRTLMFWLYGEDPARAVQITPYLEELKQRLLENPNFFTNLLKKQTINNPHRSRLTLYPDKNHNDRDRQGEKELLSAKLAKMGKEAKAQIKHDNEKLARFQQEGDSPEDIATIPFLSVNDIPTKVRTIPYKKEALETRSLYSYEIYTNGISYVDLAYDISHLPKDILLFLPLLFHLLPQLGTKKRSYSEVSIDWGLKTGGFSMSSLNSTSINCEHKLYAYLRVKMLDSMVGEALSLVRELIQGLDFSDERYVIELFNEFRNDFRSSIVPGGIYFANIRARRGLCELAEFEDILQGTIQSRFLETLHLQSKDNASMIVKNLVSLAQSIFSSDVLIPSIASDSIVSLKNGLASAVSGLSLPHSKTHIESPSLFSELLASEGELSSTEGLAYSSKVNFTAFALPASRINTKEQVHEQILAHIMQSGRLHEKIRMEGGAYGAYSRSDALTGTLSFASYRDPHIIRSWKVYEDCLQEFSQKPIDQNDLDLAKISLAGGDLQPLSPSEKIKLSFNRIHLGISNNLLQKRRDWLINATVSDIQLAAQGLVQNLPKARRTVLADPSTLKQIPNLRKILME